MKNPKCENFDMWQRNLNLAHFMLLIISIFMIIFTDRYAAGLFMLGFSFVLFIAINEIEFRHIKWHIEEYEKEQKNERQ